MMKRIILTMVLAGLALFAAACSSQPAEPVSYRIDMSEYAFSPAEIEVQVGQQVTLELVNNGTLVHELMIGREVMMMDNRPSGYTEDLFESAGVEPEIMTMDSEAVSGEHGDVHDESHTGFMVVLPASGGSASMTFTVTKDMVGEWELGCFEQEGVHYTAGMTGKLVVAP